MDFRPKCHEQLQRLLDKGVNIPNPQTVDIGDDVHTDQISGNGVTIYPGCRIYGAKTVISSGCQLGYEAPLTVENCQLGQFVELKGGFVSKSVFLTKANIGMGAHVREGCLLEEEAGGAHCVGLKQTILFPFVTLGSLINFCDCFMSGGTSRSDHSEVGSSYIHFNFTPDADKSTPSMIGDVARGVMLNQPPIFLGGQGGIVGPVRLGYGNVAAAGSILRKDYLQDNQLILDAASLRTVRKYIPGSYPDFRRLLENNILYLANLKALEEWYIHVRKSFFETQEFGFMIYRGALDVLSAAGTERFKRLRAMVEKASSASGRKSDAESLKERRTVLEHMDDIAKIFQTAIKDNAVDRSREVFLKDFEASRKDSHRNYIETIKNLPPGSASGGVQWLQTIVNYYCQRTATVISSAKLFKPV